MPACRTYSSLKQIWRPGVIPLKQEIESCALWMQTTRQLSWSSPAFRRTKVSTIWMHAWGQCYRMCQKRKQTYALKRIHVWDLTTWKHSMCGKGASYRAKRKSIATRSKSRCSTLGRRSVPWQRTVKGKFIRTAPSGTLGKTWLKCLTIACFGGICSAQMKMAHDTAILIRIAIMRIAKLIWVCFFKTKSIATEVRKFPSATTIFLIMKIF